MFWNLLATVICGLGAAGFALGIRAITAKRAPKWLIPVFAGLGMLGYLVYSEYTWFEHKKSQLFAKAESAVIVSTEKEGIYFRPWTFIVPYVTAFSAIDTDKITTSSVNPNIKQFVVYRFEQTLTDSMSHRPHGLNCQTRELVPLSPEGTPNVNQLKVLEPNDTLYRSVCGR